MGNGNPGSKLSKLLDELGNEFPSDWEELVEFCVLLDGVASLLVKEHKIKHPKRRAPSLDEVLRHLYERNNDEDYKLAADNAEMIISLLEEKEYFESSFFADDEDFEDAEEAYGELRLQLKKLFFDGLEK